MKYLVEEAEKTQSPALYIFEMRMFTMEDAGLSDNMAYTRGVTDNMKYSCMGPAALLSVKIPSAPLTLD